MRSSRSHAFGLFVDYLAILYQHPAFLPQNNLATQAKRSSLNFENVALQDLTL